MCKEGVTRRKEEIRLWEGVVPDLMSDKEDWGLNGRPAWNVKPPSFRSNELSTLCCTPQTRMTGTTTILSPIIGFSMLVLPYTHGTPPSYAWVTLARMDSATRGWSITDQWFTVAEGEDFDRSMEKVVELNDQVVLNAVSKMIDTKLLELERSSKTSAQEIS
ncbi:Hypp8262 [Branchiostoma lanceolatum]|uniref:Hypp8262 protein n=1 Tax=Branchiostoma lanceolatum TaxID=7740 RepID=A0A8J9Z7U6_BRALA|nr:Hypp8262 [Branchiostoma lanceolatum]